MSHSAKSGRKSLSSILYPPLSASLVLFFSALLHFWVLSLVCITNYFLFWSNTNSFFWFWLDRNAAREMTEFCLKGKDDLILSLPSTVCIQIKKEWQSLKRKEQVIVWNQVNDLISESETDRDSKHLLFVCSFESSFSITFNSYSFYCDWYQNGSSTTATITCKHVSVSWLSCTSLSPT